MIFKGILYLKSNIFNGKITQTFNKLKRKNKAKERKKKNASRKEVAKRNKDEFVYVDHLGISDTT